MKLLVCPPVPPELVQYLEQLFPEKSPVKGETFADLCRRGGECNVVKVLKSRLKEQENARYNETSKG